MAVLLLTGPAGAGKSTAAQEWAASRPRPAAMVSSDDVRKQVKAHYADPVVLPPPPEVVQQWLLAIDICSDMARRYDAAGFDCVVDGTGIYSRPEWDHIAYRPWEGALRGLDHDLVVLLPELALVLERNAVRPPETFVAEWAVVTIHEWMGLWLDDPRARVIDNTHMTVEETVAALGR